MLKEYPLAALAVCLVSGAGLAALALYGAYEMDPAWPGWLFNTDGHVLVVAGAVLGLLLAAARIGLGALWRRK